MEEVRGGAFPDGRALARERRRRVAARLRDIRVGAPGFPDPTLGLVAVDHHPETRRFLTLKERAFLESGLAVRARVLPGETDTAGVLAALRALSLDPGVHGLFLQYPLPPSVDAVACSDAIPVAMDVDASSREARRGLEEGEETFAPATPLAILTLLDASGAALASTGVTVVTGAPEVSAPLALLLERRAIAVRVVDVNAPELREKVAGAAVLVTCAGRPGAVDGRWIADGAVALDAGYHHAGGCGDIDPRPDPQRLATWVPARGGVGPLTVAILAEHTLEAALRRR